MNYNFFLVDDDLSVISILSKIILNNNLGDVIGKATDGDSAIEEIIRLKPDIVLVDLLLPKKDGITVVAMIKAIYPDIPFIMISEVYSKDMVSKAYDCGIELFINKPINVIEVVNVIKRVDEKVKMKKVIDSFQTAFQNMTTLSSSTPTVGKQVNKRLDAARQIFNQLGILSEAGTKDISYMLEFVFEQNELNKCNIFDHKLSDLYDYVSNKYEKERGEAVSDKTIEQRVRRAIGQALENIAELGLHDYEHHLFEKFAATLFDLKEVRKEMDYIKKSSKVRGKISIKKFVFGLIEEID
jgi:two-component system response regulator YcbB